MQDSHLFRLSAKAKKVIYIWVDGRQLFFKKRKDELDASYVTENNELLIYLFLSQNSWSGVRTCYPNFDVY